MHQLHNPPPARWAPGQAGQQEQALRGCSHLPSRASQEPAGTHWVVLGELAVRGEGALSEDALQAFLSCQWPGRQRVGELACREPEGGLLLS